MALMCLHNAPKEDSETTVVAEEEGLGFHHSLVCLPFQTWCSDALLSTVTLQSSVSHPVVIHATRVLAQWTDQSLLSLIFVCN